jgi:hypothetical protein
MTPSFLELIKHVLPPFYSKLDKISDKENSTSNRTMIEWKNTKSTISED